MSSVGVGLFHHVLVYVGDLHLVLLALNLSILNACILIMMQKVYKIDDFALNMVNYPMCFLSLSTVNLFW